MDLKFLSAQIHNWIHSSYSVGIMLFSISNLFNVYKAVTSLPYKSLHYLAGNRCCLVPFVASELKNALGQHRVCKCDGFSKIWSHYQMCLKQKRTQFSTSPYTKAPGMLPIKLWGYFSPLWFQAGLVTGFGPKNVIKVTVLQSHTFYILSLIILSGGPVNKPR